MQQQQLSSATGHPVRMTYHEKLKPTPEQDRAQKAVLLWRCRLLYTTALGQRLTCWRRGQGRLVSPRFQQEAGLQDLCAAFPEYAAICSQVLHDLLARLDKTYQAFFRRVQTGERASLPRFQGRGRSRSFTSKEYGNGAHLDNGFLVLAKLGRSAVHWSRPLQGWPKTVTVSCVDVPARPRAPTGRETGRDVDLKAWLVTADGEVVVNPRHSRQAEKPLSTAQKRLSHGKMRSKRREKARVQVAKRHQYVRHQQVRGQRRDFHHQMALALVRAYDVLYLEYLRDANLMRNRPLAKKSISDAGRGRSTLSLRTMQQTQGSRWWRQIPRTPAKSAVDAERASRRACACAPTCAPLAGWCSTATRMGPKTVSQKQSMAQATSSGTRGSGCGDEPRTRPLGCVECQKLFIA